MTKSKTKKSTLSVADAQGILDELFARQTQSAAERSAIVLQKEKIAHSALTGNAEAAKELSTLRAQLRDRKIEDADIASAVKFALAQIAGAQANELAEKAKTNAARIKAIAAKVIERGKTIDAAFATIADEMAAIRGERSQIKAAGGVVRDWEIIIKTLEFSFKETQVKFRHAALIKGRATWKISNSFAEELRRWLATASDAAERAITASAVKAEGEKASARHERAKSGLQWEDVHV